MPDQQNCVSEMTDEARSTISETTQMVKDTAADLGAQAAEYARGAGRQASAAAQNAYTASGDMMGAVEDFARENVWSSLLIAAAAGYGLACLIKNARAG